jgi:hypothetical protein
MASSHLPLVLLGAALAGNVLVGCSSTTEPLVAVVDPVDGTHSRSDGTHAVKRNGSAGAPTGFRLEKGYKDVGSAPAFEASCAGADAERFCGTNGRVSIEYSDHPLHAEPPCKLVALNHSRENGMMMGSEGSACVVGDELIATESCVMCRQPDAGWSVHARISEMTEAQAHDTFTRLNLQGSVPADADGWEAAIDRGQPPPPALPN